MFKVYAIGACALALFGLLLFAGYQYDHAQLLDERLEKVGQQLTITQASLDHLQLGIDASNAAITELAASQAQAAQHGSVVRARVQTLKGSNDAIRTWLDTPLPAAGCLLDDSCPAGAVPAAPIGSAASAVR